MSVVYWARFFREQDGRWSVDVPDMPGCLTWGGSVEEAYQYLVTEAIPGWLAGDPCPPARGPEEILGLDRFDDDPEPLLVRVEVGNKGALPEPLTAELARAAAASGRPLDEVLIQAAREYLERHADGQV